MTKQTLQEHAVWMRRGHAIKLALTLTAFVSCAFEHYSTVIFLGALLIVLVLETNNIKRQCEKIGVWQKE